MSMRKHIREFIKRIDDYRQSILILLKILSDEKHYFIKTEKNFEALFYNKFISSLVSTCRFFIDNISELKPELIVSVIDLIIIFDESYFLEKYQNLLRNFVNDDDRFYAVLTGVFMSPDIKENPLRTLRELNELNTHIEVKKHFKLIEKLVLYFEKKEKQLLDNTYLMLALFNESMVKLHNINHALNAIVHYLHPENNDEESFLSNYTLFIDEIDSFLKKIKIFVDNLYNEATSIKINGIISKVEITLKEIKNINISRTYEVNKEDNKILFKRINDLLCHRANSEGLPIILDSFEIDIKKICWETLQQEDKSFKKKEIEYDFFLPEPPCVTFGDRNQVILIFKNLIENMHKHSKGTKCFIYGMINQNQDKLKILFIDNGQSTNIEYSRGLLSVSRAVNMCRGSFNISNLEKNKYRELIQNKFPTISCGTVAEVTLWLSNKGGKDNDENDDSN